MQKLLFLLFAFCVSTSVFAQNDSIKNSNLLIKVGVSNNFFDDEDKLSIPHISARYERQLNQNIWLGGDAGFTSSKSMIYRFFGDKYFYRKNYISISVNASYYLDMIPLDFIDFYAGLGVGYKFGHSKFVGEGELSGFDENPYPAISGVIYSVSFQGRYKIKNHLYAFAEIGLGYLPLSFGFVHNFKL
jgi:hypothetical protein